MMTTSLSQVWELLRPETAVERDILSEPDVLQGLDWGVPRFGHPEGKVLFHVREVLDNIDRVDNLSPEMRRQLRLVTFVHDTFKYCEDKSEPRDWGKHHSKLAHQFICKYTPDLGVQIVTRCHDDAYHAWRAGHIAKDPLRGVQLLETLLDQLSVYRQLYYLFFKCDTKTGDKNQAPLIWFEATVPGIQKVDLVRT